MTQEEIVKKKLELFKDFRERRFRGLYLMKLALRELKLELKLCRAENGMYYLDTLYLGDLVNISKKYDSYRHAWDAVTKANENLRGKDWYDKDVYEQLFQMSCGYVPGFNQINRELAKIG